MRSLRGRLTLIVGGLALLAVAGVTVIVALTTNEALEESLDEQRAAREVIVEALNEQALDARTWADAQPLVLELAEEFDARIVLTDVDGRRLVDTGSGELPALEGVIDPFGPLAEFGEGFPVDETLFDAALLECFERLEVPYTVDELGDVFVIEDAVGDEPIERCFEETAELVDDADFGVKEPALLFLGFSSAPSIPWAAIGLIAAVVIALAALAAAGLSSIVTSPLRRLGAAAREVREGNLDVHVEATTPTEVGDLADSFNEMTEELSRAEVRRKQLTADVAHELRSPLTNILGHLDAIEDGIIAGSADQVRIVTAEAVRLSRLVDDLQTLAALDEHTLGLDLAPTDLGDLLDGVVEARRSRALEAQLDVRRVGDDPAVIVDRMRFEQVVGNLLDNAIEHSPPGNSVTVAVEGGPDEVAVSVADTGPGIDPDALPYVFDRLSRADPTRSPGSGGRGLGLAIARGLAREHGGDIVAANGETGAVFTVTIPTGGPGGHANQPGDAAP